ncbi:MAG: LPS-assembly protein LptD, partial [Beijerinckiaceae bacterium]
RRGQCLLRGIGGTTNRATATLAWRRNFIDPIGQVWTPFVSAQLSAAHHSLDLNNAVGNTGGLSNLAAFGSEKQASYLANEQTAVRANPAIGLEYRYPFIAMTGTVSHLFEPIAQIVVRPDETRIGRSPNEDSQSLLFSDANLFSLNRFSGYDRIEGGTRASVGAQYTATFAGGAYVNAMVGQSYHLAGRNSYRPYGWGTTDLLNTGLNSGLDKSRSDYVGRFAAAMGPGVNFVARGRFDDETLRLKRLELSTGFAIGRTYSTITYARQDAQPDLGFVRRREGVTVGSTISLPTNWYVTGNISLDLDRYLLDRDIAVTRIPNSLTSGKLKNSPFRPASYSVGFGYADECTVFSFNYVRSNSDFVGQKKTTTTAYMMRLELKNLGELNYRKGETPATVDGIR